MCVAKFAYDSTSSRQETTPGTLCSALVPDMQNRYGQSGEGPEMGNRDDQSSGKHAR